MATYTYSEAVEQTITAGEQIHQIVNGTATTEVTVEDGSKVPSIRKALLDNFYFKDPIAWQVGQTESVFNQLRQFTDGSWWYAPSATASNPISMGSTPVGDSLWKIYDFDAIGKLTPQLGEALRRSYAEAGYNVVGTFQAGFTIASSSDIGIDLATGKGYTGPSGPVAPGTDPSSGGFVDRSAVTLAGQLPIDSMYGDLSTTNDNTAAINERLNWSRTTGKTVELPAGRFPVAGELELGGVKVRGRSIGYRNTDGTVLVGNGANTMFNQSTGLWPYFAATKLESLRIENVICGLEFGYLMRAEFEDVHIDSTGTSIRFGRATNAGPQWNIMRRCTALSTGGSALYLNGADWCNNNTFELCFFESKQNGLNPAVVIDAAGGYGSIGNLFIGTEIASEGYGLQLKNARATGLIGAYLECHGPAILLKGTSYGTKVSGGVFAAQRNNNSTGITWAIYHESGNANIEIDKPYIVVSKPLEQDGCGFIGYNGTSPSSALVVDVTSDPITENIGPVAYTRYQDGLFSKMLKITHGDQVIQSDNMPSLSLQYEDGTKKIELYSNSIKGSSDFGGVLKVNDLARMSFTADGSKILLPGQKLGLPAEANTNAPGAKTHRIQVLNEAGAFLGYLAVYSS